MFSGLQNVSQFRTDAGYPSLDWMGLESKSLPVRKDVRLKSYDYASPGMYFVTICTFEREMILGQIDGEQIVLTEWGQEVSDAIADLPSHYESVSVDCSVVMPNHVHMILWIHAGNRANNTLGNVVCGFKARAARKCGGKVWQRGYHEHIIRNEDDLQEIRSYIANNPKKWIVDRHNPDNPKFIQWVDHQ